MGPKHAKLQIFTPANLSKFIKHSQWEIKTKDLPRTTPFGLWSFYKRVL